MSMALICPTVSNCSTLPVVITDILSEERARSRGFLRLAILVMMQD
jgi:hypothetical protein